MCVVQKYCSNTLFLVFLQIKFDIKTTNHIIMLIIYFYYSLSLYNSMIIGISTFVSVTAGRVFYVIRIEQTKMYKIDTAFEEKNLKWIERLRQT